MNRDRELQLIDWITSWSDHELDTWLNRYRAGEDFADVDPEEIDAMMELVQYEQRSRERYAF
jgi:hypothetical protein